MTNWIDVNERLPKYDFYNVLVVIDAKFSSTEIQMAYTNQGKWHVTSENGNHADFITHWMPRPNPPELVKDIKVELDKPLRADDEKVMG